jgi:rare lipoprotein A
LRASALGSLVILALIVGGCATRSPTDATARRGAIDPDGVPDAVPRVEPYSRYGNPPSYEVFGKRYAVLPSSKGFVQVGVASWYGEDFHGKRASNGETYDMFAMTAAHKELPLPTYARVTNLENGRSVVVRITDRGPFVGDRVIDLSWVAAAKLRLATKGTGLVEVRAIDPLDPDPLPPAQLDTGTRYASAEAPAATVSAMARAVAGRPEAGGAAAVKAEPALTVVAARPNAKSVPAQAASARAAARTPAPAARAAASALASAKPRMFVQVAALASRENADRLRSRVAKDLGRPAHVDASEASGRALHRVRVGPLGSTDEADLLVARLEALGLGQARVVMD